MVIWWHHVYSSICFLFFYPSKSLILAIEPSASDCNVLSAMTQFPCVAQHKEALVGKPCPCVWLVLVAIWLRGIWIVVGIWFQGRRRDFSFLLNAQIKSEAHPIYGGYQGSFPAGEVTGIWSWLPIFIKCWC